MTSFSSRPSIPQLDNIYIYYGDHQFDKSVHAEQETKASSLLNTKILRYREAQNDNKVPKDVVKVLIHPSVKIIPNGAFSKCERLQQVQFGFFSSLEDDNKRNHDSSDENHPATNVYDDCHLEIIGESAFSHCVSLKHIALPPSLRWIRKSAFEGCLTLLSVELCHGLQRMDDRAFADCYGLKNVAIPNTVKIVGESVVAMRKYSSDQADDADYDADSMEDPLIRSLRRRFHRLPIHHLCYFFYQLHPDYDAMDQNDIAELLDDACRNAGDEAFQCTDNFGMTPLHILACSARPNSSLLRVLLNRLYGDDSTTSSNASYSVLSKDTWGNYPIHYAVRCDAPIEIVKLLIDSQLANHSSNDVSLSSKEQPPHLRHRRKEPPYWKGLLDLACNLASLPTTKFLLEASLKDRIDALQCPAWKQDILNMVDEYQDREANKEDERMTNSMKKKHLQTQSTSLTSPPRSRQQFIKAVDKRLEWYNFQEQLSLLELGVWKIKLQSDDIAIGKSGGTEHEDQHRENCRIHCGAELVTMNVLNFLGNFEDQRVAQWKKKKGSIPLLPTPNPWGTVPALRHL